MTSIKGERRREPRSGGRRPRAGSRRMPRPRPRHARQAHPRRDPRDLRRRPAAAAVHRLRRQLGGAARRAVRHRAEDAARHDLPRHRRAATSAWRAPTSPATSRSTACTRAIPYELLKALADEPRVPDAAAARDGPDRPLHRRRAPAPDRAAARRRCRRAGAAIAEGLRHSKARDAEAIHHHYDVSNTFYEWVLGPSMTYTCACYPRPDASLDEAQENKYRLVFEKLRLKPGDRLLDVGCGWGGMVRYAARRGVRATRRDAVAGADDVGAARDRRRGPRRPGRGALRRLPRHRGGRLRRGVVDRAARAHRGAQLPVVLPLPAVAAARRRAAAQPLHHPPRQHDRVRRPAGSSTATSSPTASSPARAASSPRRRTSASRCCTRRTCAPTTR